MKKINNVLFSLAIGSLISFSALAEDIVLNGQSYKVLNSKEVVRASSAGHGQSGEVNTSSVRVGDKVVSSQDDRALMITGSIEVEVSEQKAKDIAEQFNLEFIGYIDGLALLNAEEGTDIIELEKALNTKVDTPVRVELNLQNIMPN